MRSTTNPCPGSDRYIAHQERVVCGALGEQLRFAQCPECLQKVQIGPDDRLIRHRPQAARSVTIERADIGPARRTLPERLVAGRRAS